MSTDCKNIEKVLKNLLSLIETNQTQLDKYSEHFGEVAGTLDKFVHLAKTHLNSAKEKVLSDSTKMVDRTLKSAEMGEELVKTARKIFQKGENGKMEMEMEKRREEFENEKKNWGRNRALSE